jgi:hypothetical protein
MNEPISQQENFTGKNSGNVKEKTLRGNEVKGETEPILEEITAEGAEEIFKIMTESDQFKQYSAYLESHFKLVPESEMKMPDFMKSVINTAKDSEDP